MNLNLILILAPFVTMGLILLLGPNMMQRGYLFAVPVSPGFRTQPEARRAIALFRWVVAIAFAIGLVALPLFPTEVFVASAPLLLLAVAAIAFYRAYKLVAPFAVSTEGVRSIDLSAPREPLPLSVWLGFVPFLILAAAALFLSYHWQSIPERFPVHWGISGTADRWAQRSIKGVYGPLFLAAELCAWLTVLAVAIWFGARRSSLRPSMFKIAIAVEFCVALIIAAVALEPVLHLSIWSIVIPGLCLPIPLILFAIRKSSEPSSGEVTPASCWKAGMIYYNPNDAVLFVQKRVGFGYTVNFANPWSWGLMAGLVLLLATAPIILV